MLKIIPLIVGVVVSNASSVAFEGLVKLVTPSGLNVVKKFLVNAGSLAVGALIAAQVTSIAVKNTESLIETVKKEPEAIDPPQDDS